MVWRLLQPTRMVSSRVTLLMESPRPLKEAMEEDLRVTDTLSRMVIVAVIISNIIKIMKYCNTYLSLQHCLVTRHCTGIIYPKLSDDKVLNLHEQMTVLSWDC